MVLDEVGVEAERVESEGVGVGVGAGAGKFTDLSAGEEEGYTGGSEEVEEVEEAASAEELAVGDIEGDRVEEEAQERAVAGEEGESD